MTGDRTGDRDAEGDYRRDDDVFADETAVGLGRAIVLADLDRPGGHLLIIDRIRQSYVDLDDPGYLDFEYMQAFADVLAAMPAGPLAVTHIGGGALTMPRYVGWIRPGSSQVVLEPDVELTELVRAKLPLPKRSGIRVRPLDGLNGLAGLGSQSADLVVLDAYLGGRVPADLTTLEFLTDVARVLRPDGVLLANVADGPPLGYLRRLLAGMAEAITGGAYANLVAVADSGVLRGRRYGNVVLAAGRGELDADQIARAAARAAFPRRVISGTAMRTFIGSAAPLTVADAQRSPAPPEEAWRVEW